MIEQAPILIRTAKLADAPALASFNQSIARETEDLELDPATILRGVQRFLSSDLYGFYTVAEADHQLVGSLMITYEWSDWRDGVIWWIQSVYVKAPYRRQGIYSNLYTHVRQLAAADEDVRAFRLYVEKDNHVAQQTYGNLGMRETHYRLFEADSP